MKRNLKHDLYFKEFFSRNKKFTKDFLESVLNREIKELEIIKEAELERIGEKDKLGRIDLKVILDSEEIVDVEMQFNVFSDWKKRVSFYASKLYSSQIKNREEYANMKNVIIISILDFNITDYPEYISKTVTVLEKHRESEFIDTVQHIFIELPKFRNANELKNNLDYWLTFIDDQDKGAIEMIKKDKEIFNEADRELKYLTGDEALQRIEDLRQKAELDEKWAYSGGVHDGIKQGIEQGERKEKIQIAKKMKEENADIDFIAKVTGLTKEEIEKL